jgi:hypothetical protein
LRRPNACEDLVDYFGRRVIGRPRTGGARVEDDGELRVVGAHRDLTEVLEVLLDSNDTQPRSKGR